METKYLVLDPAKCNGCRECESACSIRRTGRDDPALSCIRIFTEEGIAGFYFPLVCFQCSDPPCLAACPVKAITIESDHGVRLRPDRCIGCRMCVSACPFGAMGFDVSRGRAFKCDLCEGDPACLRCCVPKALTYANPLEMVMPRTRSIAVQFIEAAAGRTP